MSSKRGDDSKYFPGGLEESPGNSSQALRKVIFKSYANLVEEIPTVDTRYDDLFLWFSTKK